jgi:hypothetical protein
LFEYRNERDGVVASSKNIESLLVLDNVKALVIWWWWWWWWWWCGCQDKRDGTDEAVHEVPNWDEDTIVRTDIE